MPAFKQYLEPYSKECDLIVSNRVTYDRGLSVLRDHLNSRLRIIQGLSAQPV